MLHVYRMLMKSQRIATVLLALVVFVIALWLNVFCAIVHSPQQSPQTILVWGSYILSFLIITAFFVVGLFVWFQARNRRIAPFFLLCCLSMMIFLTIKTHSIPNRWIDMLYGISSICLIICFSVLLVLFPDEALAKLHSGTLFHIDNYHSHVRLKLFINSYICMIIIGGVILVVMYLGVDIRFSAYYYLLSISQSTYLSLTLPGLFCLFLWSYSQAAGARERSQLFLLGCVIVTTCAPFLAFSVASHLSDYASLFGILAEGMLFLLPWLAGYAILRSQILLFDTIVCKWLSIFYSVIFFAFLVTCLFTFGRLLPYKSLLQHSTAVVISIVLAVSVVTPIVWRLARFFTENLLFREIELYRRLFDEPTRQSENILEIDDAVHLISTTVLYTLQSTQVYVFVFDDSSGQYVLHPDLATQSLGSECYMSMANLLYGMADTTDTQGNQIEYLDTHLPVIEGLERTHRPHLLSVGRTISISRPVECYFSSAATFDTDYWLLAPIRAQGKMIGLLLLGPRDEKQPYTGTDLEIVQLLTERYAITLETARLYARVSHHTHLLNSLYNVSIMPNSAFSTVLDAATTYATYASRATSASVEMWLYDRSKNELKLSVTVGHGPHLFLLNTLKEIQKRDWSACFFSEGQTIDEDVQAIYLPSCLSEPPSCPFAWLPLYKDEQYMGIIVITYAHPHVFLWEEMFVLEMFANQCLSTLENVQMTTELRVAYERQKDLDLLKDQFIMTASHELRTPLTAVLGYIELLDEYHEQLEAASRTEFIEKARLGCDELSLLVSNIVDASHVNNDTEVIRLRPVSLMDTVAYVVEMLEATITREKRVVTMEIDPAMYVSADHARLRQVLLNLVSNALKYSPEGSSIDISAHYAEQQIIVRLKDHGLGVPPLQQEQIFERFVRLERDINSPVRGAGLGLFICRRLLESMGGEIWIESNGGVGEGSVVVFALQIIPKKQHIEAVSVQIPV